MNDLFDIIKLSLSGLMEKEGSSLLELEEYLTNNSSAEQKEKIGSILDNIKLAEGKGGGGFNPLNLLGMAGSSIKGIGELGLDAAKLIPEYAFPAAMLAGAGIGAGAYGINKAVKNDDHKYDNKKDQIMQLKYLTQKLHQEHNL